MVPSCASSLRCLRWFPIQREPSPHSGAMDPGQWQLPEAVSLHSGSCEHVAWWPGFLTNCIMEYPPQGPSFSLLAPLHPSKSLPILLSPYKAQFCSDPALLHHQPLSPALGSKLFLNPVSVVTFGLSLDLQLKFCKTQFFCFFFFNRQGTELIAIRELL